MGASWDVQEHSDWTGLIYWENSLGSLTALIALIIELFLTRTSINWEVNTVKMSMESNETWNKTRISLIQRVLSCFAGICKYRLKFTIESNKLHFISQTQHVTLMTTHTRSSWWACMRLEIWHLVDIYSAKSLAQNFGRVWRGNGRGCSTSFYFHDFTV